MQEDSLQTNPLFRYVLGDLTEAEQARIEEECFADPLRQQELWGVFDEVAERFLQDELAAEDARKFAARVQASPRLRERVENLHALLRTIESRTLAARTATSAPTIPAAKLPQAPAWTNWFAVRPWGWLAAGIVMLALGLLWWSQKPTSKVDEVATVQPTPQPTISSPVPTATHSSTDSPTPKPTAHATPTATPPRAGTGQAVVATFFILQEITRDQSNAIQLTVAQQVEAIALQLEVRPPLYPLYQITMQTGAGSILKTEPKVRPQRRAQMSFVTLHIPLAKLTEDTFTVQISGLTPGQEPKQIAARTFQVEKKGGARK